MAVDGTLGHLPQDLPLTGDLTVAEVLGIAAVIRALDADESGGVSEEHFTTIGDDWDMEERTRARLARVQGAFVVISHDERFLAEFGGNRRLRLADGTLTETGGWRGVSRRHVQWTASAAVRPADLPPMTLDGDLCSSMPCSLTNSSAPSTGDVSSTASA